ncbi:MAG: aminotransferase class V-fold PLP-dependent enzyme, partial [Rickettsiaceae bacterium]|nr:aminotransferase class V-fold PLP-dependent enzyme [Rickettsiaceae bacterium]
MTNLEKLRKKVADSGSRFPIYLDSQATTKTDPRVVEAMLPYFTEKFGNPHSKSHSYAWEAEEACELARSQVANLIGASAKEIIFTSGATESNNMALKGIAKFYGSKKKHIVTVLTEHKCILDTCRHLEQEGFRVTYLPVKPNGIVDLDELRNAITEDTMLVSVMAVNNEIGVVQPLKEIGQICREKGAFFHSDIAQA